MLGRPKPEGSGRKPGSENKIKGELRLKLAAAYEGMTDAILEMAADPDTPPSVRVDIWKTLGKKVVPDLTATTLNPDDQGKAAPLQIVINPPAVDHDGE